MVRAMVSSPRFLLAAALVGAATLTQSALATPSAATAGAVQARAPVTVAGLWCGAGLLHKYALEIAQEYERVEARLIKRGRVRELTGRMEGPVLHADPQREHTMDLLAEGNELRIIGGTGMLAMARGQFFTRAVGGSCTH
jgi:hypothetical protein